MKRIILFAVLACASFVGSAQQKRDSNVYVYNGDMVPQFEVLDPDGSIITSDEIKGKYALVVFFATWCHHCQGELPELQAVYAKYGNRADFKLMPINQMQKPEEVATYFKTNNFTMPFYIDRTGEALRKFASGGVPRSFLINPDGIVLKSAVGYSKDEKTGLSTFMIISRELERIFR